MNKRGVTLIETLIYIALFALLIGGGVSSAYVLIESSDRIGVHAMLEEEGNFLLAKINWALDAGMAVEVNAEGEMTLEGVALSNTNVEVKDFVLTTEEYSFTLVSHTGGGQEISEEFRNTL